MIKTILLVGLFFVNIILAAANDCPHLKLAKAYIPKTFSAFTGKSGKSGKQIYKIKPLTDNNYLVTGSGGMSIILEEKCGLVSFELPFTLKYADENEQEITFDGNYMCEGVLRKNMNISGTCVVKTELPTGENFEDTVTFKWRPKK